LYVWGVQKAYMRLPTRLDVFEISSNTVSFS